MTTNARGLKIFDVTNVSSPVLIGTVQWDWIRAIIIFMLPMKLRV